MVQAAQKSQLKPQSRILELRISGVPLLPHRVDPIRILTPRPVPFQIKPPDDLPLLPDGIVRVFGIHFPIALFDEADRLVTTPYLPQDHVTFS